MSWEVNKKWSQSKASDTPVKFDVFCAGCNKLLGEGVSSNQIDSVGIRTHKPNDIFCNEECMKNYEINTGGKIKMYGLYDYFIPDKMSETLEKIKEEVELFNNEPDKTKKYEISSRILKLWMAS